MKPRATYRLQLTPTFGFAAAKEAVAYLAALGISHLYLSPVLQAAEGSTHGYDVVDPDRVSDVLGGESQFLELVDAAKRAGLGILLDIVPNHMSIVARHRDGTGNRWWLDVLENGQASYYAHFFDVDWELGDPRVLLPVLPERYGRELTSGHLAIVRTGSAFEVRAGELRFPLSPRSLGVIVKRAGERIGHPELQFVGDTLAGLSRGIQPEARARRHRDKAVLLRRLAELCTTQDCSDALATELQAINSDPFALDAVLEQQHYRLCYFRVAESRTSYRRFFDISELAGIRNEDPEVFEASHHKILGWLADGVIDGVRIDHVDGLREPAAYLRRLRDAAPTGWIVVEKILAGNERLPASWPIDGTTGYDFIETMTSLFVDPAGERRLTDTFQRYTGEEWNPRRESRRARLEVMTDALHGELGRLTELGVKACSGSAACRDYTRPEIETALAEIFAGYSSYRTYLGEDGAPPEDRERIAAAAQAALEARPELDRDLVGFLEAALAFELPSAEARELAIVAQQVTGAIIAKGDEDTLLYRQVRLLSRNEVGSELAVFARPLDDVHRRLETKRRCSILASSTHDTKRGEDVRARIAVISELPEAWEAAVERWRARADGYWGEVAPDRVLEYAIWQTLVGAWPISLDRVTGWAEKATREARLRTSWRRPDSTYDAARDRWLASIFADGELTADIAAFAAELAPHGARNSLAQTLVKLTAPGIPDFYQGAELRDDSLVDPDNRRPVDLELRARVARELGDSTLDQLGSMSADLGTLKLWLIRRVLRETRAHDQAYEPLAAIGPHAHRVFAFRHGAGITVVPRLGVHADGWRDTTFALPPGPWRDVLADRAWTGTVAVGELWRALPVAWLVST